MSRCATISPTSSLFTFTTSTTYETVFRMINELTEDGAVTVEGKGIKILDEGKLRELVSPNP